MRQRLLSLDMLRGLSIFGMVFSAIVPSGVLPPWMYHIQNPPPTHNLDMAQAGITWVDMVFPIFIFCMGVAIPLSGRAKLAAGKSAKEYFKDLFTRFFMLWGFAYLCVLLNMSNCGGALAQLLTLAGFCALFPLYLQSSKGRAIKWPLRAAGILLCLLLIFIGERLYGFNISLGRRSIIIFLLAFLYLFGGAIWYLTRERLNLRALIFALLLLFTLVTQYLEMPATTYANSNIRWWFNMEEFYFLLLLLPATYVGDLLSSSKAPAEAHAEAHAEVPVQAPAETATQAKGGKGALRVLLEGALSLIIMLFCTWTLYFLYKIYRPGFNAALSRESLISLNLLINCALLPLMGIGTARLWPRFKGVFAIAALFLLWGLLMDPLDNGIKKVPCTISYCFVSFGISALLLIALNFVAQIKSNPLQRIFAGAGTNPLMSYVAYYILLLPILKLTGIMTWLQEITASPLAGVARAALLVLISMWIVSLFSRKKIFWRA